MYLLCNKISRYIIHPFWFVCSWEDFFQKNIVLWKIPYAKNSMKEWKKVRFCVFPLHIQYDPVPQYPISSDCCCTIMKDWWEYKQWRSSIYTQLYTYVYNRKNLRPALQLSCFWTKEDAVSFSSKKIQGGSYHHYHWNPHRIHSLLSYSFCIEYESDGRYDGISWRESLCC